MRMTKKELFHEDKLMNKFNGFLNWEAEMIISSNLKSFLSEHWQFEAGK
jgi:hypothetical protein